jgi:16S rRNA (cytosine967-C5)-methyltransferase
MRPGARISAAIEVIDDIVNRHRPASVALADWGKSHRFAGSGDRSAVGTIVYDTLRVKAAAAYVMSQETPRALVLGALQRGGSSAGEIAALCTGEGFAPPPLSEDESGRLEGASLEGAPSWVIGNYPEWLQEQLSEAFGAEAAAEGEALARRAPVDLRVNTLKADRAKVLKALGHYGAEATPLSSIGVRVPAPAGSAKQPHVETEAAHGKGWFEVQDEGSQIAALLAGAGPRMQVLDLCAGAGGKTLALAASMQNTGQVYAYDADKSQLRPIFERLQRAGARNVQVLTGGDQAALTALGARFDVVLVDAPCTGAGTWRRRPDSKWRLKPANLAERQEEQRAVLDLAAGLVKPGGRLVYVTCSVLPAENTEQVQGFLASHQDFALQPYRNIWASAFAAEPPVSADGRDDALLLTPRRHGTDGFFIASLLKTS